MNKQDCIIVDLEGTLSNCKHRVHHLKNKNYDEWNKLFLKDTVNKNMVGVIEKWKKLDKKIIMCTAKKAEYSTDIVTWLLKYELFYLFDLFYFRDNADERPSAEVKKEMLLKVSKKFNVVKAYDDRPSVFKMYQKWNINVELVSSQQKTPADILKEAAVVFENKNKEYGNSYKDFGKIMMAYFPNGLELKSEKDFTRFTMLNIMISKTDRYCKNFKKGHEDSLNDLSVYSAMLNETDQKGI